MRLEGKTAVVTGAAGGMGRVACRRFCEEGARVLGLDLDEGGGRELQHELEGQPFEFRRCDITSSGEVAAAADHVRETFGELDVLYNNAGTIIGKPITELTDEEWERTMNVNLRSAFLTMREYIPCMRFSSHCQRYRQSHTAASMAFP